MSVVAAAAAVTAIVVLAPGGSGDGTARHQGIATGNVLLVAASNAEKAPTGRYWHTETVDGDIYDVGKSAADHYEVDWRQRSTIWVGTDGKGRSAIVDEAAHPVTPEDMVKWRQAGSPKMVEVPNPDGPGSVYLEMQALRPSGGLYPYDGAFFGLTAGQVAKLPTDAKALENVLLDLKGRWHAYSSKAEKEPIRALWGAERTRALSDVVGTLLAKAPAPPRVRAAAFRMLATLPGVKVGGTATDPMGRTGSVVSLPLETTMPLGLYTQPKQLGSYLRQWIIDPAGGRLLAIRDLVATPPLSGPSIPPAPEPDPLGSLSLLVRRSFCAPSHGHSRDRCRQIPAAWALSMRSVRGSGANSTGIFPPHPGRSPLSRPRTRGRRDAITASTKPPCTSQRSFSGPNDPKTGS